MSNLKYRAARSLLLLAAVALPLSYCTAPQTAGSRTAKSAAPARRVEILFLGDNGHHRPVERIPALMAALGDKGINLTYTDNLEDLNPATLARYDGLLIYANWDSLPAPQEKALLDYVASGKGLIPVHCASYCFRNSAEYVKLVGGQFWRHKMDTVRATITDAAHPAVAGLGSFGAYDETYLHEKLGADNHVLMTREIKADQAADKPNQKTEPYTWTRTHGQGRVFYTAYGHDERTWEQPGFHALLERGILWAVGDRVKALHDALRPEPFAYAEANLPNYEKRPGPQLQQKPLSPTESVKHIQVPAGFSLEVFAHEPDVVHPIAMTWDERGRLFVLITKDYPNERKETGGSDYILLCEDTDRDGKADKFTRYADGLSVPTGLVPYDGGLIVSQAPHMLYLKDTDGDDKADTRKILFTGFGTFDTHAGPSNLHYGFDNWIWGSVGYSGFKGKMNGDSLKFSQGFFRFKPDGSALEYMTSTSNNTWGLAFNETGDVFGSTANNAHGWYMPIPHRYFGSAPGVDNGSRGTDTHKDMKPITPKVRQVDVFGGFTAAAGHNFYTARAFPKKYWNTVAFVSEPTGHVVHQNVMAKSGTDFEDREGFNLLAGADEWVSPVFAQVGPDGAVWVADWYSFIIQHNPTPKGFENGPGNAYQTDLRDYTHGRLYRIAWKEAPAYTPQSLSKEKPQDLVAALKNNNMFWRQAAQRLLVERGQRDVVPGLLALVKDPSMDEIGINPAAIHALWTLHGLGALDGSDANVLQTVTGALKHPCAGVRKTAVQVLPRNAASVEALLTAGALHDKEPLVTLNALLALSEMPATPAAGNAVLARLAEMGATEDRWLPDAFACNLTAHEGKLLKTYLAQAAKGATKNTAAPGGAAHAGHHQPATAQAATPATPVTTAAHRNAPDLVVTGLRTDPVTPAVRETVRLFVEVQNRGSVAIPPGTVTPLAVRIEGAGKLTNLVSYVHTDGLKPGEKVVIEKGTNGPWTGPLAFSSDRPGTFTVTLTADRDNRIAEGDEANNSLTHQLTYQAPPTLAAYALERAARSYASVAPADSVVALLRRSQSLDPAESGAVLKGAAAGWGTKRTATLNEASRTYLAGLSKTAGGDSRDRLNTLLTAWGLKTPETADLDAQVVTISVVREALKFSLPEFTVKAGKPVEIVLTNPDAMQHNLVIGKPKSLDVIGNAADKMITAPDGAEKNYVPAIPQVIAATPLVNPDGTYRLKFTAPAQPGAYPFVCTFPGHWRVMNGVMKVE
jgi:putative membrane-bound dehydrogenase-like protein